MLFLHTYIWSLFFNDPSKYIVIRLCHRKGKKIMKKQGSKFLLVVLTFFMIFGCVNIYPIKAETTQKEYEIYPKPHSINYEDGNYSINTINICLLYTSDAADE